MSVKPSKEVLVDGELIELEANWLNNRHTGLLNILANHAKDNLPFVGMVVILAIVVFSNPNHSAWLLITAVSWVGLITFASTWRRDVNEQERAPESGSVENDAIQD